MNGIVAVVSASGESPIPSNYRGRCLEVIVFFTVRNSRETCQNTLHHRTSEATDDLQSFAYNFLAF